MLNFRDLINHPVMPIDLNNNKMSRPNLDQPNGRTNNDQFDPCDLNLEQLSLEPVNSQPKSKGHYNHSKLRDILESMFALSDGQKFLFSYHFNKHLNEKSQLFHQNQDFANNLTKVKSLLLMKKETAISELLANLPYVNPGNREVKITYLRIMPVLFSHVSLYDVSIDEIFQIVDLLRIHPAFTAQQGLFAQWFAVFETRRKTKKHFSFKDESYVRGLPALAYSFSDDSLTKSVGYSDIALLRAIHRWLRLHRLHKYLYFFANLSYEEILDLNDQNFETYQEQVNLHIITVGAKHKILREIEVLRDRRTRLVAILKLPFQSYPVVEGAIREIKKLLRTPISVKDPRSEKLPILLLEAMSKVFEFVIVKPSINETMLSIFGLLISLCKEAWNYHIFRPEEREWFNDWRHQLTERTSQTSSNSYIQAKQAIFTNDSKLRQQTAGNSYYQCLEEVANNCADFILNN